MKKIFSIVLITGMTTMSLLAQNIDDALRYSQVFYGGTARFISMGGAFTALGGDISTLSQNPAGLGVYRSSELSITPQLFHIKTSAGFNGIKTDYLYNFNLNQIGIVANMFSENKESGLISLNLGYSFNKTNNLNQSVRIQGLNPSSSMTDFWASESNGFYHDELGDNVPDASLAYNNWLIDTLSGKNTEYGTVFSNYGDNYPSVYGQNVRRLITNEGYTGENAFSIGGNYSNKIFFGATLGISRIRYTSNYEHFESTDINLPSKFDSFTYTDHYENTGTGYSLKIGAIIKPVETVRIGFAFHSPTYYKINEYFFENMTSSFTDGASYESSNSPLRYKYALSTPFRFLAGAAVQIKKLALISADYEFVDYSTASFSETGDNYDYSEKNMNIKNSLKPTSNLRLGGEVRLNNLYLRTGYGLYGKPFKSGEDNSGLDYRSVSFGAGFREQNVSVDFAYSNLKYTQTYIMYPLDSYRDPASSVLATQRNMFTLTLSYKFGM
jgi:hypothetical protein